MSGAPSAGQPVPAGQTGFRKGLEYRDQEGTPHSGVTSGLCPGGTRKGKRWLSSRALRLVMAGVARLERNALFRSRLVASF